MPYVRIEGSDEMNKEVIYIFSASFIESICIILRKYEAGAQIRLFADRFINLFFNDLEARLGK
jgi:hypothetical protein